MTFVKCKRLCNHYGISKVLYLACTTLLTAGFIVECILIHLVVLPYMQEEKFVETNCTIKHSYFTTKSSSVANWKRCENKCSRNKSKFPCLVLQVRYKVNHTYPVGTLYDLLSTYTDFHESKCSTAPCKVHFETNKRSVDLYNQTLYRNNKKPFQCFYNTEKPGEVLLAKMYSYRQMIHCVLWPTLSFGLGIFFTFFTYCCAGCSVWTQDQRVIA